MDRDIPFIEITQENNPIRWLQEMVDTGPMQDMPREIGGLIVERTFGLGADWPPPRGMLVQLANAVHEAQTAGYELSNETMDDLQEIYRFLSRALNAPEVHEIARSYNTEELGAMIYDGYRSNAYGMVSLGEINYGLNYGWEEGPSHEQIVAAMHWLEQQGRIWCLYDQKGELQGYRVNECADEPRGPDDEEDLPF